MHIYFLKSNNYYKNLVKDFDSQSRGTEFEYLGRKTAVPTEKLSWFPIVSLGEFIQTALK
jgi:hypothetical protein